MAEDDEDDQQGGGELQDEPLGAGVGLAVGDVGQCEVANDEGGEGGDSEDLVKNDEVFNIHGFYVPSQA
ncbi:MAG TPA: hypothetical protein DCY12_01305 [Candidatus Atribacteria bacterium]|nr:hypothetical protein [Candidatus Atribacteria bacterium]